MKKQITYVLAWHSACQSYLWSVVSKCIIPKGAVADRARKDIRKNEWEVLCLFRKLLFATSLPPGPLDTKSAVSTETRAKCDLTEWRLPAEFRPGPQTDCRTAAAQLSTQSELPRPCLRLNRLDGSRSASTARLCQVGSTLPA
jgi:hypothetical protein